MTRAEAAKFADALKPLSAYLSGSTPDGPPRSKIMPAIKAGLDQIVIDQTSVRSSCDVWGGGSDPSGSIRAVRTSEGLLGAAILRCTKTTTADPGREIYWNEPHVSLGILIRTDGAANVVGGNLYPVPLNPVIS